MHPGRALNKPKHEISFPELARILLFSQAPSCLHLGSMYCRGVDVLRQIVPILLVSLACAAAPGRAMAFELFGVHLFGEREQVDVPPPTFHFWISGYIQ